MVERIFKCELCGGTFTSTWTEAEALAEAEAIFGPFPSEERMHVCDVCWNRAMIEHPPPRVGRC